MCGMTGMVGASTQEMVFCCLLPGILQGSGLRQRVGPHLSITETQRLHLPTAWLKYPMLVHPDFTPHHLYSVATVGRCSGTAYLYSVTAVGCYSRTAYLYSVTVTGLSLYDTDWTCIHFFLVL